MPTYAKLADLGKYNLFSLNIFDCWGQAKNTGNQALILSVYLRVREQPGWATRLTIKMNFRTLGDQCGFCRTSRPWQSIMTAQCLHWDLGEKSKARTFIYFGLVKQQRRQRQTKPTKFCTAGLITCSLQQDCFCVSAGPTQITLCSLLERNKHWASSLPSTPSPVKRFLPQEPPHPAHLPRSISILNCLFSHGETSPTCHFLTTEFGGGGVKEREIPLTFPDPDRWQALERVWPYHCGLSLCPRNSRSISKQWDRHVITAHTPTDSPTGHNCRKGRKKETREQRNKHTAFTTKITLWGRHGNWVTAETINT